MTNIEREIAKIAYEEFQYFSKEFGFDEQQAFTIAANSIIRAISESYSAEVDTPHRDSFDFEVFGG